MRSFPAIAVVFAIAFLSSRPVRAQSVTTPAQSAAFPQTSTDVTATQTEQGLPFFRSVPGVPADAILDSVQLNVSITETLQTLSLTNGSGSTQNFYFTEYAYFSLTNPLDINATAIPGADVTALKSGLPSGPGPIAGVQNLLVLGSSAHKLTLTNGQTVIVVPGTGQTVDPAVTALFALVPNSGVSPYTFTHSATSTSPSSYDQTGNFSLGYSTTTRSNATGGVGINPVETGNTNATFSVTYTYHRPPDLFVTKTHPAGTYNPGSTVTYTIVPGNNGPLATGNTTGSTITVADTLPAGMTATSLTGTGWTCGLAPLQCTSSAVITPGAKAGDGGVTVGPITLVATIGAGVNPGTTLTNSVTVSGGGEPVNATFNPGTQGNDTATDPLTLPAAVPAPIPDMTITKAHNGTFTQGEIGATYTIVASNVGNSLTSGTVTVTDQLPVGLTATGMAGSGWTCTLATLTCTRSDLLGIGVAYPPITLTVNVSPTAAGTLVNNAVVGGGGEFNLSNDYASDFVTLVGVPDMTITKSHTGTFKAGQTGATYTLGTSNVGTQPTSGVVSVTDTLPVGLTATGMSGDGWACTLSSLTCTRSDVLAAGAAYPSITVTVDVALTAKGTLVNTGVVGGGGEVNLTNDTATDPVVIQGIPDMTITKSHTGTFVQGQTGTYTIGTSNVGNTVTSGTVTVTDTLPAGLTATAIAGAGWTCGLSPLQCTRADALAAGAAYPPITLTVSIATTATGTLVNTAVVGGGSEVNLTNDTATDPVTIVLLPDMTIAKTHAGSLVRGGTVTYTITASNVGGTATSGTVTVTDTLPAGLVANSLSGTGWTCTLSPLVCTRSDVLAAGAAYPAISLTATIAGNAPDSVVNTAVVGGGGEVNLTNDTATDPATLSGAAPNLGLTKTHTPPNLVQGGTGTYFLTISNNGTAPTIGAVFADDPLTTGLTATSISGDGWTCTLAALECTRPDVLNPGASYPPVIITVSVAANAPPTATNIATVTGGGSPPGVGGTLATDHAPIASLTPTLNLVKTADRQSAQFGDVVGYQLTITNQNTAAIQSTTAQDVLPHGFVYVANSARMVNGAGAAQPIDPGTTPGILIFNVGTVNPGQSVVVTYRVRVTAAARVGPNVNTAQVTASGPGGVPAASPAAGIAVDVTPGLLTMQQFLIGRVFEDANGNGIYDPGERPVAGARIYLSNGQSANTDTKGMYNIPFVSPGSVTVTLDPATLPKGYTISSGGRLDAEDWSRLQRTPLQGGMILRQNFGIRRCPYCQLDAATLAAVRASGPVSNDAGMRLAIAPGQDSLPADGRSGMAVEVRLLDAKGVPVPAKEIRIRTSAGQFLSERDTQAAGKAANAVNPNPNQPQSLFGVHTSAQMGQTIEQVPQRLQGDSAASPTGVATFTLIAPNTPGTAVLIAETGDPEHLITTSMEVTFLPQKRKPILSSVGEITVGRAAADYDIYQQSGIVSRHADAFMSTPLGTGNLLTMAYTSHLAVNDSGGNAGLFQLDPLDRAYQVFGDSSTQYAAAQSTAHVYARLERGLSYAVFGDLHMGAGQTSGQNTPAPQSFAAPGSGFGYGAGAGSVTGSVPGETSAFGLGDYNRNLLGAAVHLENKQHDSVTLEGAKPNTAFARDVFPGSTFGLIQLTHTNIMPGSETVTLQALDQHNPAIVVSSESLVRSVDYTLDPATGAVFFLRSLNAYDQALDIMQVVFTYEYETVGVSSSVYAVRIEQRIPWWGTRLGFGVTQQNDPGNGSWYLGDFNLQQNLPRNGRLVVEMPVTYGSALAAGANGSLGSIGSNVNGTALRIELNQPIGLMKGRIMASVIRTDAGFFNPYGATTLPGSQTSRGSVELSPAKKSTVKFAFTDERNSTSLVNNQRQTVSVEWKQALTDKASITAGYDFRDYNDMLLAQQTKANMLSAGLDWRFTSKLMASVRREQNVEGSDPTYPNETLLSARYQATETVRMFITQRFASAPIVPIGDLSGTGFAPLSGKDQTSIGVEDKWSRYTTMQSSYLVQNGINGTDSYAVIGLMNRIPVSTHFSVELGLQRGELLTGKDGSFNASSFGFSWLPQKNFKWSTRYELRDQGGLGQIFTTGVAGKVADGLTALGRFQYSNAAFQPGSAAVDVLNPTSTNATPGAVNRAYLGNAALAWRPWKREKEGVLFSYTLRSTDLGGTQTALPQTDRVNLLSTDGYYELNRHVEFYNKFAWSDRTYNYVGYDPVSTNTYLWQGRVQTKISRRFDAAYEVRVVDQPTSSVNEWTMAVEGGIWLVRDLRAGVGYSFKSADDIADNFLTNPVRQGAYFVLSSKLSNMFNLFEPLDCGCAPPAPPPAPKPVAKVQISAITGAHDVCPGENLQMAVTASGWLPGQTPVYQWYIDDKPVEGANGPTLMAPTLRSGTYTVKVTVTAGDNSKTAEPVSFTVKPLLPPTVRLSALPLTIPYGDHARLTSGATGSECTDPVSIRYTASDGSLNGLDFDSAPMVFDMQNRSKPQSKVVHFTAVATDKVGQTATADAEITVTLTPVARRLDDVVFTRNGSRVNNCGKRLLLEELTPMLRDDPDAKVILIGHRDNGERQSMDTDRVLNAAAVLSAGTGICPQLDLSRILTDTAGTDQSSQTRPALCGSSTQERAGSAVSASDTRAQFRRVEIWFVPGGAALPGGMTGLKPAPEKDVKAKGCPR